MLLRRTRISGLDSLHMFLCYYCCCSCNLVCYSLGTGDEKCFVMNLILRARNKSLVQWRTVDTQHSESPETELKTLKEENRVRI